MTFANISKKFMLDYKCQKILKFRIRKTQMKKRFNY